MKTDPRLKKEYLTIHTAIHSTKKMVPGLILSINTIGGLRYADYDGFRFIQQNPNKSSKFAKEARGGKKITWGMPTGVPEGNKAEPWLYIDDEVATRFTNQQIEHETTDKGSLLSGDSPAHSFGHIAMEENRTISTGHSAHASSNIEEIPRTEGL
jgi:hypothetical protein